ncbi:MAG: hypothetical protein RBU30_21745, partial [Polyangia bacterium]|nr:hypothetical protein [Polyangia bacterium]
MPHPHELWPGREPGQHPDNHAGGPACTTGGTLLDRMPHPHEFWPGQEPGQHPDNHAGGPA